LSAPPWPRPWRDPLASDYLSDGGNFIKCISPLGPASWRHMLSLLPRILSWGRLLLAGWWSLDVACVMPVPRLCRSCRDQATFGEMAVGEVLSSSLALALLGGVASRLLVQPTLWTEPVFLSLRRGDSWDASRQIAVPLAYPRSHPHDTSPQNWQSLMGQHGALAGSIPR
jgi:hypothetical protein